MKKSEEQLIGPMAAFIGARLQYPCPEVNGQGNPWTSTILVQQHKEKFWAIRIYCKLAWPDLVKQKWDWLRDRERRMAAGEKFYDRLRDDVIRSQLSNSEEPTEEFKRRCLKHDAIHYRKCYREMVALQPQLQSAICGQADRSELLYPPFAECEARIDEMVIKGDNWIKHFCDDIYHLKDVEELKAFLKSVYDPSFRDVMELRD